MEHGRNGKGSIFGKLKWLIVIMLPLLIVYMSISVLSTYYLKRQIVTYVETFVDFYVKEIEDTVTNINRRMSLLILGEGETETELNSYITNIRTTENIAFRNYFISKLKDVLRMYSMEYGEEYHFFAFFPQDGLYVGEMADKKLSLKDWELYQADLTQKFENGDLLPNSGSQYWEFIETADKHHYILKFYSIRDIYIGCWIRPEDLTAPLEHATKAGKISVLLFDKENRCLFGDRKSHAGTITIGRSFKNLPFKVTLFVYDYGMFQKVFLLQVALVVVALAMLVAMLISIYYLYKKVMGPIKKFSNNLERLGRGQSGMEEISESELYELEQANTEFRQLLRQIHHLQEEVYESELKKQLMYLEYLKIQIEPHFYLNCLNFIYNMVDLGKYEQAEKMAWLTAEYMRYLFKNGGDYVQIWEEVEHIKQYLEIQKLRFGSIFDYYVEQEEEVRDGLIPPMMIQTFVENCIKYAVNLESCHQITVTAYSEEVEAAPYVNLCITDNGPGFSDDLLIKLKDKKSYMDGETDAIGISNAIKRLYYTYGKKAEIYFYNGPVSGAVVEIHIPYNTRENGYKGERHEPFDCG